MIKTLEYEQIWTMEDWIADIDHIADRVFTDSEEIQWITQQGYAPRTVRHYDPTTEILHYKVCFDVPEEFITWLTVKYPNWKGRTDL